MKEDFQFDPVCGMQLSKEHSVQSQSGTPSFCSDFCKSRYESNPERFKGTPFIQLKNIHKDFKLGEITVNVLRGFSMNIWKGDFVAIIGASGSGKSTALNMLGLLDVPTSGHIFLDGQDVAKVSDDQRAALRSSTFGFVFQQYNLVPWLTARENVTLPMLFSEKQRTEEEVDALFEKIGLKERMIHRPVELSGGEQQRTALLRSLINDPKIIIGDEPTGNLDSKTGEAILNMLIDLNKKSGKTLIIVTHDEGIAEYADQVIVVKDGITVDGHKFHKRIYTE